MLPADQVPAQLIVAPAVQNDYVIPGNASVREVKVTGWRLTLEAGFRNAFSPKGQGTKLELLEAELSFSPAAMSNAGGTAAIRANIRFKARLVDASGAELRTLASSASAREVTGGPGGMTQNASLAVEAMYEMLTKELLSK